MASVEGGSLTSSLVKDGKDIKVDAIFALYLDAKRSLRLDKSRSETTGGGKRIITLTYTLKFGTSLGSKTAHTRSVQTDTQLDVDDLKDVGFIVVSTVVEGLVPQIGFPEQRHQITGGQPPDNSITDVFNTTIS